MRGRLGSLVRLSFLLVLLHTSAAMAADGTSAAPEDGDWLVRHLGAEPATLNPITATDVYESLINSFVYESLVKRDNRTLDLVPLLAERWEISPNKLAYTFTLKEGIRWHDGRPLTVDDVVFTFQTILDPKVDAPHLRNYFRDLVKVEALDERRVRFTFSEPYFKSLEMIGGMSILPKHVFGQGDFNTHPAGRAPMGTGPYRFVKWETGKEVVLERNEHYWGTRSRLARVVFTIITDETVALQVHKRGDTDLMSLNADQWVNQTGGKKYERVFVKLNYYLPGYSYIGYNLKRPYFSDARVRRAMTMLLDREAILKNIRHGLGRVVTGPFFYESPEYDRSLEPWPYDPKAAAALLDQSGWKDSDGDGVRDRNGTPFRFEFTITSGSQFAEQVATVFKEQLARAGIQMTIRPLEWALFTKMLDDRTFDAVTLGWSFGPDQDPYQVWHSSQAENGSNFIGYRNAEADRIIEEGRVTFDRERRMELYRRFHRILHEEQPYTFLLVSKSLVSLNRRFQNVIVYPLGLDPTEWWVPKKSQEYR